MAYPKVLPKLERPPLIFQSVQDAIKAHILDNGIKAGDTLPPETELARQLGVSRNSVREAVKALESTGVLESRRGSGVFVKAFSFEPLLDNLPYGLMGDVQDVSDLLELRQILELAKIESAIHSLLPEQITGLEEVLAGMQLKAKSQKSFPEEDRMFHHLLFKSLGNHMLLKLLDVFWLAVSKASKHINLTDPDPMRTFQDHVSILTAVKARDAREARKALDQHYEGIRKRLENIERR